MQEIFRLGRCGRLRCPQQWRLPQSFMAGLEDHVLWFVWAGRGTMRTHFGELDLLPGVGVWMVPGGCYEAEQDPDLRLGVTYLHFTPSPGKLRRLPEVTRSSNPEFLNQATKRIVELTRQTPSSPQLQAMARRLLETVMDHMVWDNEKWTSTPGMDPLQLQIIHQVAAEMRQPEERFSSVSQFARRAGYSPDHFAKLFHNVTGCSPRDYLIQHRIADARQLLADTNLKVEAVGEMLGYRNAYFFSRQFRQQTGLTPSGFRRLHSARGNDPPPRSP